jgi:hypothetical protein
LLNRIKPGSDLCLVSIQNTPFWLIRKGGSRKTDHSAFLGLERMRDNRAAAQRALKLLLEDDPVLPFGDEAAASYGIIRAAVRNLCRQPIANPGDKQQSRF